MGAGGAFDSRKHPGAVAGGAGGVLSSGRGVGADPVGADVPGRRGGGCWCSCRGLFAFLHIICGLHVAVFGVSSYYMEKFKPGGGWCSVFVEKTNKEKKRKHENV